MSGAATNLSLDALLADFRPPPMADGLADRVVAAALALPQAPAAAATSRGPRHDRRGRWLRRPLLIGGTALGIAFTGAVAASLAGVELPRPVAAWVEKLPLIGKAASEPVAPPVSRRSAERPPAPPPRPEPSRAPPTMQESPPLPPRLERRIERLERAREIVEARRAAGLPTPRADRIEARRERMREIVAARRAAGLPTPRADRLEARHERVRQLLETRRQRETTAAPTAVALPPPGPPAASPGPETTRSTVARQDERQPGPAERRERLRQRLAGPERAEWIRRAQERRALIRRLRPAGREGFRQPPR